MTNKTFILTLLLSWSIALINLNAQGDQGERLNIRIPVSSKKSLSDLPAPVYRENLKNDSLDLLISGAELPNLKARFPGLKVLPAAIELDESDMAADLAEAFTFTKYPTYQQYDSMMHYFADTYPEICMIDTFGRSSEGRLLLAVKISDNVQDEEDEAAFLYTSTMHGDELIGYVLTLRLIDFILSNYGSNIEIDRIVDQLEIWINPLSNPDMTFAGGDHTVAGSLRADNKDLNRNFPAYDRGDENDTSGIYLENQLMMLFMTEHEFNMSANLHAGAEVVNYPWDYAKVLHPDNDWFVLISREYADVAHDVNPFYMDDFPDGITHGAEWYVISGGRQDYTTAFLHGREVTLELSNTKKISSEFLESFWTYNQWSLINMISQAMYGIHGKVTSGNTGESLKAHVWVMDHDDETSWVESDSSSGNFYRYMKEGVYDLIVSSDGYISDTILDVEVVDYYKTELRIKLDSIGTGIHEQSMTSTMKVYPNPVSDILKIELEETVISPKLAEVYNAVGALIYSGELLHGEQGYSLNVSRLSKGYYVIRIRSGEEVYKNSFIVR